MESPSLTRIVPTVSNTASNLPLFVYEELSAYLKTGSTPAAFTLVIAAAPQEPETFAPRASANCTANAPTAPLQPLMNMREPLRAWALSMIAAHAVVAGIGRQAASPNESCGGFLATY